MNLSPIPLTLMYLTNIKVNPRTNHWSRSTSSNKKSQQKIILISSRANLKLAFLILYYTNNPFSSFWKKLCVNWLICNSLDYIFSLCRNFNYDFIKFSLSFTSQSFFTSPLFSLLQYALLYSSLLLTIYDDDDDLFANYTFLVPWIALQQVCT